MKSAFGVLSQIVGTKIWCGMMTLLGNQNLMTHNQRMRKNVNIIDNFDNELEAIYTVRDSIEYW